MKLTSAKSWFFLVSESSAPERSFSLKAGSLILGSSPDCAIASTSDGIAPRHAEFLVIDGTLHIRVLEGAAPVLLRGRALQGTVALECPASLQCGSVSISITAQAAQEHLPPSPDSTLRLVHPAGHHFPQITEPDSIDITARIVHRLPDAETAAPKATAFSEEATMAFSMESLDIALEENIPVRTDYSVKEEIARGGMGKIYSARDAKLDRLVALKVSTVGDRSVEPQFFREAKTLAALEHPNVVPIHNLGTASADRPFYSMKLVHGQTLQSIIKRLATGDPAAVAAFTRARLLDIFRKVCDAVGFAHSKGYLHRDLKPDNIMVGEFGEVLVMDWGIAKRIHRADGSSESAAPEPDALTYIEGTPQYMSPEQANGMYGGLDERSDVYSLGGILYAILTLRPPVSGSSLNEVLDKVRKGETTTMAMPRGAVQPGTPAQAGRSVPEALRAVTVKAMNRERERRYQSVGELANDIEAYLSGFATRAEEAGLARHMILLIKRHRLASSFAGAALIGALLFTARLAKSEALATREAARANAKSEEAARNEKAARESEARANISLAEAAEQAQNAGDILRILDRFPQNLRNQEWKYIARVADSAKTIELGDFSPWYEFAPHPKDPDLLFTLHQDGWIRTVNLETGDIKPVLETGLGFERRSSLAISPDGDTAAVYALAPLSDKPSHTLLKLIDLRSGISKTLIEFPPDTPSHYTPKFSLEFNTKGTVLLAQTREPPEFHAFDVATKTTLRTWKESPSKLPSSGILRFSPDGSSVILSRLGADPVEFSLTDRASQEKPSARTFKTNTTYHHFIVFPGQTEEAFTLTKGVLRKFDTRSGRQLFETRLTDSSFQGTRFGRISQLAYLPNQNLAVSLTSVSDAAAALFFTEGTHGTLIRTRLAILEKNTAGETEWQLVTHPLSNRVAVARGKSIKVWTLTRPEPKVDFSVLAWDVWDAFGFVNGPSKVVTVREVTKSPAKTGALLEVMDLDKKGDARTISSGSFTVDHATAPSVYISTSADGKRIGSKFTNDAGGPFVIWNVENGILSESQRIEVKGSTRDIQISPSGRLLWTSSGAVEIASKRNLGKIDREGISDPVDNIPAVWAGESRVAEIKMLRRNPADATSKSERVILTWEVAAGRRENFLPAPEAICLEASPDGALLVEGGEDMRVRFRDAATLEVQKTLRVHDGAVTAVAWHPSLPLLATGSSDRSVKVWDLKAGEMLEEFQYLGESLPCRVRWSPDGKLLAVSESVGTRNVKVYEPKACKEAK